MTRRSHRVDNSLPLVQPTFPPSTTSSNNIFGRSQLIHHPKAAIMSAASGPSNLVEVSSPEHFTEVMQQDLTRVSLLNFHAPWAEPCKQMNEVVREIAIKYPQVLCLAIEAESLPDVSESFDIEAVPSSFSAWTHFAFAYQWRQRICSLRRCCYTRHSCPGQRYW